MANFLAYKRATQEVVLLETLQGTVTPLGTPIGTAAVATADLPARTQNLVGTYLGTANMLYVDTPAGDIYLARYNGVTWPNVGGFAPLTTGVGQLYPIGLQVVRDRLLAVATAANTGAADGVTVVRSNVNDDTVFTSSTFLFPIQPTISPGGHTIMWRNALFVATAAGLLWYGPATATFAPTLDTGSDAGIDGVKVTHGCFAVWNGDLYYLLPTVSALQTPKLYKLITGWSLTAPPAAPAWELQTVAFPVAGALFSGNDTGTYALFVNTQGVLTAWYSGASSTKVVLLNGTTSGIVAQDVTAITLSNDVSSKVSVGWCTMNDDRRRSNEHQIVVGRDIAASPQRILIFAWSGNTQADLIAALDDGGPGLELLLANDGRSDFRLFTNQQPTAFITSFSAPFAGRTQLNYTLRDSLARPQDVFGEYSLDGQTWLPMTQGSGDSGATALPSSPVGTAYFYYWDAYQDLTGAYTGVDVRLIARIAGP